MSKTALIDGDLLFYAVAAAAEYGKDPDEVNIEEVYHSMEVRAANVMIAAGCDKRRIFLTGKNFRYWIAADYKGNRKDTWRPSILPQVRAYAELFMGAEIVEGLEADDMLAVLQTEDTVICSIDKDLQQIDGAHYRWDYNGKEGEMLYITEGWRKFYTQLLTGDATDGIIGCGKRTTQVYKTGAKAGQEYIKRVGVGPKQAEQVIAACNTEAEAEEACYVQYKGIFGSKALDKMVQQGRLLYMVRELQGRKAKMWTPLGMDDAWMDVSTGEWLNG